MLRPLARRNNSYRDHSCEHKNFEVYKTQPGLFSSCSGDKKKTPSSTNSSKTPITVLRHGLFRLSPPRSGRVCLAHAWLGVSSFSFASSASWGYHAFAVSLSSAYASCRPSFTNTWPQGENNMNRNQTRQPDTVAAFQLARALRSRRAYSSSSSRDYAIITLRNQFT